MKVVINKCYGGFGLSEKARKYMGLKHEDLFDIDRENPKLVEAVEALGEKANGMFARLKVVEIPDDVEYEIDYYDGLESIHEKHRVWE